MISRFGQLLHLQRQIYRQSDVSVFSRRSFAANAISSADLQERRRRVLYHSRQRGFLELDLILGSFSEKYLPILSEDEVDQYCEVLEEENPDLFKWLSGQGPVPDHLKALPVVDKILAHVNGNHPNMS